MNENIDNAKALHFKVCLYQTLNRLVGREPTAELLLDNEFREGLLRWAPPPPSLLWDLCDRCELSESVAAT